MGWVLVADRPMSDRQFDLGIDTASDDASLALFVLDGPEPLAVKRFRPEVTMSRELLGVLAEFLSNAGVDRTEIARIAVTTGPGQYGPLRTGIAVAQGMALALEVPLAGVGRLEADASLVAPEGVATVVAVHDTRTGPAWAAYEVEDGLPRQVVAPSVSPVEEAVERAPRPATWTGEVSDGLREALRVRDARPRDAEGEAGDTITPVSQTSQTPRAVAIVRIARARGAFGDPAAVDAVYLRPPPITPPKPRM